MNICRFQSGSDEVRVGWVVDHSTVLDLAGAGIARLRQLLEADDPVARLQQVDPGKLRRLALADVRLCAPVDGQEVWAAGVTYLRSKAARMEESEFGATAYDRVYVGERPELFFKATGEKVVGPGEPVGIRGDAKWSVPEPELALVMNSRSEIVGCTIGNDMSSRDIEGENLLYLPQAKIYNRSCSLGPWVTLGATESTAREWRIQIEIRRDGHRAFTGETSIGQIKRRFSELARFLFRCQVFPHGAILLTGTGIVPPDTFTLRENDEISIGISGIGWLRNPVSIV